MKRTNVIAVLTALLLLSACTSEQSVYEKAIADYVQTDKRGTWTDLKFKALSVEKTADITVADSLKLLQTKFEKSRDEQIASQQKTLNYFNDLLKDNQSAKYAKQAVDDQLSQNIATATVRIDSLRNLTPEYAARYKGRNPADIVAIVVKCRYRYVMPGTTEAKELTDSFVLMPDGKKVVEKTLQIID